MPDNTTDDRLTALVTAIQQSAKYRHITPSFIRSVGVPALQKTVSLKEAIKATKNALHQVGGAYLDGEARYTAWEEGLRQATATDAHTVRQACRDIMRHHASMRERLPLLDTFYTTIFADLPPITSVLDIACGLHPLALPWMPLAPGATYYACDIYTDMMAFLQQWFDLFQINGTAQPCDVTQPFPFPPIDVALLLKAIPCLEQIDKTIGVRLLETIPAPTIIASFPAQTLGGRKKGMVGHYEQHFYELMGDRPWQVTRHLFPSELVFVVRKGV